MVNAWNNFWSFIGSLFSMLGSLGRAGDHIAHVGEDKAETWRKGQELENAAKLVKLKTKYAKLDDKTKTELINSRKAKADAEKPQAEQEQKTVEETIQMEFGFDIAGSDDPAKQKQDGTKS